MASTVDDDDHIEARCVVRDDGCVIAGGDRVRCGASFGGARQRRAVRSRLGRGPTGIGGRQPDEARPEQPDQNQDDGHDRHDLTGLR